MVCRGVLGTPEKIGTPKVKNSQVPVKKSKVDNASQSSETKYINMNHFSVTFIE